MIKYLLYVMALTVSFSSLVVAILNLIEGGEVLYPLLLSAWAGMAAVNESRLLEIDATLTRIERKFNS